MFSAYFVFNCLNMFYIEKIGVRVFCGSAGDSPVAKPQSRVHPEAFGGSLTTCENFRESRASVNESSKASR